MFFVVRNYWRGLMSAVFGILIFRLLSVWNKEEGVYSQNYNIVFTRFTLNPDQITVKQILTFKQFLNIIIHDVKILFLFHTAHDFNVI